MILTPGPFNETYFEHSYLARYLGFTLVQGSDLTVRENRVFLKTLEGLQPIDVILRRLDDSFCDPLELRADSFLGVAGLVEAVRAGNIVVANGLGSGLVETASIMPLLSGLCAHVSGRAVAFTLSCNLVVWAKRRATLRFGAPRPNCRQTRLSIHRNGTGVRPRTNRRTAKQADSRGYASALTRLWDKSRLPCPRLRSGSTINSNREASCCALTSWLREIPIWSCLGG